MKYYLSFLAISLLLTACYTDKKPVRSPDGEIHCGNDYECPTHYYCGFKHAGGQAVCKAMYK